MFKKLLGVTLLVLLFGCNLLEEGSIVGSWKWEFDSANWETRTFNSNNTCTISGAIEDSGSYSFSGTYSYTEDLITIELDGDSYYLSYELDEPYLIFKDSYNYKYYYRRQ